MTYHVVEDLYALLRQHVNCQKATNSGLDTLLLRHDQKRPRGPRYHYSILHHLSLLQRLDQCSPVGDALVAKLKTETVLCETVNFLVWSYRMEEPKNLRDAWKQKHEVLFVTRIYLEHLERLR